MPTKEPSRAAEDGAGAAPASRRGASARAEPSSGAAPAPVTISRRRASPRAEPGSATPPRGALEEEILAREWRLEAARDQIEDLRSALAARDAPGAAEAGEARAAAAMFVDIEELRRAARAAVRVQLLPRAASSRNSQSSNQPITHRQLPK